MHHLNNNAEPGLGCYKMNCVFLLYWTVCIQAVPAEFFSLLYSDLSGSQCSFHKCKCGCCSTITSEDASELCCKHLLSHRGERPTHDAHLEKLSIPGMASQHWFPLWCFTALLAQTPCGCLKRSYAPALSCSPLFFGTSANVPDLLTEGSPLPAARGEGAEIKGVHKRPAEVLPSPLLALHGIGIAGFYKSPPSIFAFMGISSSLVRAERVLRRITFSKFKTVSVW